MHGNVKYRINQWNYLYIAILYFHLTLCEFIRLLLYGDETENKNKKRKESIYRTPNEIQLNIVQLDCLASSYRKQRIDIWYDLFFRTLFMSLTLCDLIYDDFPYETLSIQCSPFLDIFKLQRLGINHSKMPFQKNKRLADLYVCDGDLNSYAKYKMPFCAMIRLM